MNFYGVSDHLVRLKAEWDNFRHGRYPEFVTQLKTGKAPETIPVFSFHDVDADQFESQLRYLKRNGYETLTADEYLERVDKTRNVRVVMLTFDDGYASVWNVAYPLLKKYGMNGVAFVLPGETKDAEAPRARIAGSAGSDNDEPLCVWPELAAMSGVLDIQSHSLYHWIMFVSQKLACFYTPKIRDRWLNIDLPIGRDNGTDNLERDFPLGTPFYDMDSRLSDKKRIFEPLNIREACAKHVAENGNEDFFNKNGWRKELTAVHDKAASNARFVEETDEERIESISRCLFESKNIIEEKLPGHKVDHFCFPFAIGGKTALKLAQKAGYRAVYWGVSAPDYTKEFTGVRHVTRIKSDYIYRLPGEGRRPLSKLLLAKLIRRFGK